jgi:hypothetical protein
VDANAFELKEAQLMKISIANPNNCLYCGRKLSFYHFLRDLLYCTSSHKSAHVRETSQLALTRLTAREESPSEVRWKKCEQRMNAATAHGCGSSEARPSELASHLSQNAYQHAQMDSHI